jgi:ADP-ribose pyrophosphatase
MSMPAERTQLDDAQVWVKMLDESEDYAFGRLFRIVRAKLQYRRFDGAMSAPVTRINFERGESVGVLLHDPSDDTVVLVRQFRYPVYAGLAPAAQDGDDARLAWLLEIVAGVQDAGRNIVDVANKELLEEAGYRVTGSLHPIATIYPSPGGSSERIHLFLGEVDQLRGRVARGGGVAAEGEDTQVVVLSFSEALAMIARGDICDAKTIIALQDLALRLGLQPYRQSCPGPPAGAGE